jgi:outer membrane protein OmpU
MKKILIATTALVATAGMAAADVKLSGYGRFGLDYNGGAAVGTPKTQVNMRMRINIDGSVESDTGVVFGGRIRMQYTDGQTGAALNAAQLYATYEGMRMEVGNANTAIDSVALMYNSEIGYLDRGFGDPIGSFTAYDSGPYAANRMGVFFSYKFGDGQVRLSYINPNQSVSTLPVGTQEELSISADYKFGQFTVAAAYADNAGFTDGLTSLFLGAEYAVNSDANVGLLYFREELGAVDQTRVTLYGNYTQGAITYKGYIANDDSFGAAGTTETAFGLGLDYDLGGARLAADIHRSYTKDTVAGLGVRFDF